MKREQLQDRLYDLIPLFYIGVGLITLGALRSGLAIVSGLALLSAGWLAWLGLHLWYLVGFRNRLRVMINWTWRYFDWPSGPRLIVADAETVE